MDLGVRCLSHQEVCESSSGRDRPVSSTNCTESTQAINNSCVCTTITEDNLSTLLVSNRKRIHKFRTIFWGFNEYQQNIGSTNRITGSCSSGCYYGMDCIMCLLAEEKQAKVRNDIAVHSHLLLIHNTN